MKSIKHLSVENDVLKSQIAFLSDEVIKVVNSKKSPKPAATDQSEQSKSPTLLIGGPSVRGVACMDPSSLLVKSRGGAKIGNVLKSLKEMDTDSYADFIIHVGTNDCATKCPTDKIFNNFHDISVLAKRVSRTGIMKFSSITPRFDNLVAAARGVEVNDGIRRIAEEGECVFVCHQDNFLCRNGDISEELLSVDGLHLSKLSRHRETALEPEAVLLSIMSYRSFPKARWRPSTTEALDDDARVAHSSTWRRPATQAPTPCACIAPVFCERPPRHYRWSCVLTTKPQLNSARAPVWR